MSSPSAGGPAGARTAAALYRLGDAGPAVAEIRGKLARLDLLESDVERSIPDLQAHFDQECDRAVRAFQQQRGLTVDGIVGPATYGALEEARWRLGDRILSHSATNPMVGDDVAALQARLVELGFDTGRADGVFGEHLARAVRDFQYNVGLRADGTCGPGTFKALDRLARTVVGGRARDLRESEQIRAAGPTLPGKIVVIDPGHGGDDPGKQGHDLTEAAVVADLAARVEGRLAATGVTVYLTRGADGVAVSEHERAALANSTNADVVISLHLDGSADPRAHGVATYYFGAHVNGQSAAGERFAGLVQREIVARTDLRDCRTHAKTWDLLRYTRMPAVRIELGYVTNPDDAARLGDPDFRDVVAEAIVVAVQRLYLPSELDSPTGVLRLSQLTG
jgi:N-acetylmuramoyl-L-alanine amidase